MIEKNQQNFAHSPRKTRGTLFTVVVYFMATTKKGIKDSTEKGPEKGHKDA